MDETSEGGPQKVLRMHRWHSLSGHYACGQCQLFQAVSLEMLSELIMNYSVSSAYIVTTAVSLGGDPERQLQ